MPAGTPDFTIFNRHRFEARSSAAQPSPSEPRANKISEPFRRLVADAELMYDLNTGRKGASADLLKSVGVRYHNDDAAAEAYSHLVAALPKPYSGFKLNAFNFEERLAKEFGDSWRALITGNHKPGTLAVFAGVLLAQRDEIASFVPGFSPAAKKGGAETLSDSARADATTASTPALSGPARRRIQTLNDILRAHATQGNTAFVGPAKPLPAIVWSTLPLIDFIAQFADVEACVGTVDQGHAIIRKITGEARHHEAGLLAVPAFGVMFRKEIQRADYRLSNGLLASVKDCRDSLGRILQEADRFTMRLAKEPVTTTAPAPAATPGIDAIVAEYREAQKSPDALAAFQKKYRS